ncbi:glyoxalase [Streptomyces solincola]|uniref:Glyoxalase n=1 Tax=Streptomyces solincola TaxID=2100817 RepID=A0A2S9PQZ9_9ACTN|nr:VOC family protein [Streptomyces solincola]PRH76848.1 glyoxalase [Streptomyces solincola]
MSFTHVLAVVAVRDMPTATEWYARLFGRPADARPMDGLADWHVAPTAWVQVYRSPEQAGSSMVNLVVPDLDRAVAELAERGITAGAVESGTGRVRFAAVHDPDGNRVALIESPAT